MTAHSQQEGKGKRHSVKWGKGAMCLDLFLLLPLSLLLLLMWLSALHFVYTQHHKGLDNRRIVLAKYSSLSWYPSLLITDQIFTTQVCFTTEPMRLTVFSPHWWGLLYFSLSLQGLASIITVFLKFSTHLDPFSVKVAKENHLVIFLLAVVLTWSGEGLKSRGQQLAEPCSLQSLSSLMAFPRGGAGSMACGLIKSPGNGTNIISLFILKSTKSVVFILKKVCDGFHN